jgi:hypothetical protein
MDIICTDGKFQNKTVEYVTGGTLSARLGSGVRPGAIRIVIRGVPVKSNVEYIQFLSIREGGLNPSPL